LGLKIPSLDLQINCAINFYFYLYLMLHACTSKFDVTENFEKKNWFLGERVLVFGLFNKA
jgi:hypothetical protein